MQLGRAIEAWQTVRALAMACALVLGMAAPAHAVPDTSAATFPAVVHQPRPFGYVLGDTLMQRILLRSGRQGFEPATLPPTERAGLWFARRSSSIERAEDGTRWLVIDYQLVNAPQTLMTVSLPSLVLQSKTGGAAVIPEWPVSIAPLTPRAAFAKGGLQELRPDHAAPLLPTLRLRRQLQMWAGALALTVTIWLGWWLVRSVRVTANQPFAAALREIRRVGDDSAAGWLALHRAFDRTAGRALQVTTLPVLFERAPHFGPQRAAIEQFYAQSTVRFFAADDATRGGGVAAPAAQLRHEVDTATAVVNPTVPRLSPRFLANTLRRLEKQHER